MRHRTTRYLGAAVAATLALAGVGAGTAGASPPGGSGHTPKEPRPAARDVMPDEVLAEGLAGPLHLDASPWAPLLVSQAFAGTVSKVGGDGTVTDLVVEPGNFMGGVGAGPFGSTLYLTSGEEGSLLKIRHFDGKTRTLADLGAFEEQRRTPWCWSTGSAGSAPSRCCRPDLR